MGIGFSLTEFVWQVMQSEDYVNFNLHMYSQRSSTYTSGLINHVDKSTLVCLSVVLTRPSQLFGLYVMIFRPYLAYYNTEWHDPLCQRGHHTIYEIDHYFNINDILPLMFWWSIQHQKFVLLRETEGIKTT